jgi:DnaK suppressor protein
MASYGFKPVDGLTALREVMQGMGSEKSTGHIRDLKLRQDQLNVELERLRESLKSEVDPDADEGDPDLVEREKSLALVKALESKLKSIDHALQQAQKGTYGICERCGQPIAPERLEAMPEATLCVQCKAIVERQTRVQR